VLSEVAAVDDGVAREGSLKNRLAPEVQLVESKRFVPAPGTRCH
jgi:hypothetical protein